MGFAVAVLRIETWIEPGHMNWGFECHVSIQYFFFMAALVYKAKALIKCMDLMVMRPAKQFDPKDMPVVFFYGIQKMCEQSASNSHALVFGMHHYCQV